MNNMFNDVKKSLGIHEDDHDFDTDILLHMNTTLSILFQLGIGDKPVYATENTDWCELLGESDDLEFVKTYLYLRTRLIFDPPASGVSASLDEIRKELEWRIYSATNFSKEGAE